MVFIQFSINAKSEPLSSEEIHLGWLCNDYNGYDSLLRSACCMLLKVRQRTDIALLRIIKYPFEALVFEAEASTRTARGVFRLARHLRPLPNFSDSENRS